MKINLFNLFWRLLSEAAHKNFTLLHKIKVIRLDSQVIKTIKYMKNLFFREHNIYV